MRRIPTGRPPVRSEGFTLLELLLAFVVFALSFATVLEILSGSMRNTIRARHYTEAALTAQSVMDQVGLEIPIEVGMAADGESGDYRWELEMFAYEPQTQELADLALADLTGIELVEVWLEISWGEYPREQRHVFSTVKAMNLDRMLQE